MKISAKGGYTRQLKISDNTERFLQAVEKDGRDANALASVLLETAVQMLRNGHIQYKDNSLICQTDRGRVEVKLDTPRPPIKNPYAAD